MSATPASAKALEREVRELRRANEVLTLASAFFAQAELDRFGVEPICRALAVAPSGYRRRAACERNPAPRCARAQRDAALLPHVQRVWDENLRV